MERLCHPSYVVLCGMDRRLASEERSRRDGVWWCSRSVREEGPDGVWWWSRSVREEGPDGVWWWSRSVREDPLCDGEPVEDLEQRDDGLMLRQCVEIKKC